jgi:UDP-glucose 4-epimerase
MDLVFTRDVVSGTIGIVDNFDKCVIQRTSAVSDNVWSNFKAYNEQVLELGSGQEITVNDAVNEIKRAMHADLKIHYVEMRRGEIDGTRLCANISRVSRLTGFQPKVSLRDGLTETIAYYKEHLALIDQGVL